MQGELGISQQCGGHSSSPCSLALPAQRQARGSFCFRGAGDFPNALATVEAFPFDRVGWPLAGEGTQPALSRKGFYCPNVFKKKLFDLVNLYSTQKAAAAIKPAYSCSEGAPETATGSG